ncbi:MAG: nucleoside phosphorylase [Candidatus Odinarchaeota archaeon]|nr:nucleoside phosphorylase [Candidatus Odinarchaeota archaeon]
MSKSIYPDEVYDFWVGFKGKATDVVLLTADKLHAEKISKLLDSPRVAGEGRGSVSYIGMYKDTRIMIASSSIGTATTAIIIECLAKKGAKAIIRVGMAGSLREDIDVGDILIVSGAIRDDGISGKYLDPRFPTIPDFDITESLVLAARMLNVPYKMGVVWTHDAFFLESIEDFNYWSNLGVSCVDMETAGLFAVSQRRSIKSGAILAISEPRLRKKRLGDVRLVEKLEKSIMTEGEVALEAAYLLIKKLKVV